MDRNLVPSLISWSQPWPLDARRILIDDILDWRVAARLMFALARCQFSDTLSSERLKLVAELQDLVNVLTSASAQRALTTVKSLQKRIDKRHRPIVYTQLRRDDEFRVAMFNTCVSIVNLAAANLQSHQRFGIGWELGECLNDPAPAHSNRARVWIGQAIARALVESCEPAQRTRWLQGDTFEDKIDAWFSSDSTLTPRELEVWLVATDAQLAGRDDWFEIVKQSGAVLCQHAPTDGRGLSWEQLERLA